VRASSVVSGFCCQLFVNAQDRSKGRKNCGAVKIGRQMKCTVYTHIHSLHTQHTHTHTHICIIHFARSNRHRHRSCIKIGSYTYVPLFRCILSAFLSLSLSLSLSHSIHLFFSTLLFTIYPAINVSKNAILEHRNRLSLNELYIKVK